MIDEPGIHFDQIAARFDKLSRMPWIGDSTRSNDEAVRPDQVPEISNHLQGCRPERRSRNPSRLFSDLGRQS